MVDEYDLCQIGSCREAAIISCRVVPRASREYPYGLSTRVCQSHWDRHSDEESSFRILVSDVRQDPETYQEKKKMQHHHRMRVIEHTSRKRFEQDVNEHLESAHQEKQATTIRYQAVISGNQKDGYQTTYFAFLEITSNA